MVNQIARAKLRYKEIHELLLKTNDKQGLQLLDDLVASCIQYFQFVANMERIIHIARYQGEAWEQRERIAELDRNRKSIHDGLLARLTAFNRWLTTNHDPHSVPAGGIFSLDPTLITDRTIVGDWSGYLVQALAE